MYSRLAGSRFDPRRARAYLAQPDTNADGDTERRSAIKADLDAGVRFLGRSKRSVVKGAAHDRPLVPAEATRKLDSCAVLHGLGATPATPVTILSDGADGPRSLGETANAPRGAHLISKVRSTGVTLDRDYAVAERWARRPFRRSPHALDGPEFSNLLPQAKLSRLRFASWCTYSAIMTI
jgi:hypothetical protein